jgi:hypothetical protein
MKKAIKIIIVFIVILGLVASYVMLGFTSRQASVPVSTPTQNNFNDPFLSSEGSEDGFTGPTGDDVVPSVSGPLEAPPRAN